MPEQNDRKVICQICHEPKSLFEVLPARLVRDAVIEAIHRDHPDLADDGYICLADLNRYRMERVRHVLEEELGGLSGVEVEVVQSLQDHDLMSRNVNEEFDQELTFGEKVADRVAEFGGSWPFIFAFAAMLITWIAMNSLGLPRQAFDPYPYILLNLVLSCLAAVQAPVIMMSQNRQEARDRLRAEQDYQVNLKAELEIRGLNARIEELLRHQWHGLLEVKQLQTEMMAELAGHRGLGPTAPGSAV